MADMVVANEELKRWDSAKTWIEQGRRRARI